MRGAIAIQKLVEDFRFDRVLDIGMGAGEQSNFFLDRGKTVCGVDLCRSAHYRASKVFPNGRERFSLLTGDFMGIPQEQLGTFDCVWACHILEHALSPVAFLRKMLLSANTGGVVAIVVPPPHDTLLGGHLNLYNAGQVAYQMVMAGFNCAEAKIHTDQHDIAVIAPVNPIESLGDLDMDTGDIRRLAPFLPPIFRQEGCNAKFIGEYNW